MKLQGRVALVTGGAIRVGRAIALELAGRGAHVAITYRSSEREATEAVELLRAQGVRAQAVRCDQREPEQVTAAAAAVREALGPVDVLVNSASIFNRTPFDEATLDDWEAHMQANLRGPWLWVKALAPAMRERGEGVVVNILDISVDTPYNGFGPYTASKAGLVGLTKSLARELAPAVRVNGVAPGTVLWPEDAPEEQKRLVLSRTPLGRIGTPEDIARAVAFVAESGDFMTGSILSIDGGRSLT